MKEEQVKPWESLPKANTFCLHPHWKWKAVAVRYLYSIPCVVSLLVSLSCSVPSIPGLAWKYLLHAVCETHRPTSLQAVVQSAIFVSTSLHHSSYTTTEATPTRRLPTLSSAMALNSNKPCNNECMTLLTIICTTGKLLDLEWSGLSDLTICLVPPGRPWYHLQISLRESSCKMQPIMAFYMHLAQIFLPHFGCCKCWNINTLERWYAHLSTAVFSRTRHFWRALWPLLSLLFSLGSIAQANSGHI